MKKSLYIFLAITNLLTYCEGWGQVDDDDEGEFGGNTCTCGEPKRLDPAEGNTTLSNGLNCGSTVNWKCTQEWSGGYYVRESPKRYQTCENGKWVPEFEGDPWCEKFLKGVDPCDEWDARDLCKNGSYCTVYWKTNLVYCACRPYTEGTFCDQPSDRYCVGFKCDHGDCELHEKENGYFDYKCTCHDGWLGYHCDIEDPCVKANKEGLCKGGSYCKPTYIMTPTYGPRTECQCRPFTTGISCNETSEEYCSMPEYCQNGECIFHDGDKHYYTCECHEGWFGAACHRNEQALCAREEDRFKYRNERYCLNGGECFLRDYGDYYDGSIWDIWEPRCRCPENTTGFRCETLLNE